MSGVIKADIKDAARLNELIHEVTDEIIKVIIKEHEKYFEKDSQMRNDPIFIATNAYNMALNFIGALCRQVTGTCLEMQMEYSKKLEKKTD